MKTSRPFLPGLTEEEFEYSTRQLVAMVSSVYAIGAAEHGDRERLIAEGLLNEAGKPTTKLCELATTAAVKGIFLWQLRMEEKVGGDFANEDEDGSHAPLN